MSRRRRDASVARQKRRVEQFGERNIDRVISREIIPQFPDARNEVAVWVPKEPQPRKVFENLAAAGGLDLARGKAPTQRVDDLDVDKMGHVQGLSNAEETLIDRLGRRQPQQGFDQRGRVDDDHSASRPARIIASAVSPELTGARPRRR